MKSSTISYIVNKAKSAGCFDRLIVIDDNYHIFYVKSQTATGYFDNGNEVFVSLNSNPDPIRSIFNDPKAEIEFVDYDHITSITLMPKDEDVFNTVNEFDFEQDEVKPILKRTLAQYLPDGFLYNNGVQKKTNKLPEVVIGKAYEPYVPENEETEDSDNP